MTYRQGISRQQLVELLETFSDPSQLSISEFCKHFSKPVGGHSHSPLASLQYFVATVPLFLDKCAFTRLAFGVKNAGAASEIPNISFSWKHTGLFLRQNLIFCIKWSALFGQIPTWNMNCLQILDYSTVNKVILDDNFVIKLFIWLCRSLFMWTLTSCCISFVLGCSLFHVRETFGRNPCVSQTFLHSETKIAEEPEV